MQLNCVELPCLMENYMIATKLSDSINAEKGNKVKKSTLSNAKSSGFAELLY